MTHLLHKKSPQDGASPPPPHATEKPNPVHRLFGKLEEAFSADAHVQTTANKDCVAAIKRFLKLTGWSQGSRRVFESMPHASGLETVEAFRTILFRLGFRTIVEPAAPENLRKEYLPCFLRTKMGKLVLLEAAKDPDSLILFDPASSRRVELAPDKIEGTVIFPERKENTEQSDAPTAAKWSAIALQAFRPTILKIFLLSLAVNIFALAPPIYVMNVYDNAIGARSVGVLLGLSFGVIMIIAADFGLRQIRGRLQAYLGARLDNQANEATFRQLLHLPLSYVEDAPIGSQLTRLRQMTSVREAFIGALATALFDLPFVLLFVAVTAVIGGRLVWAPLALIALYAALAAWAIPRTRALVKAAGDAKAHLNNLTVEAVSGHRAIKDLAAEKVWLRRQRRLSAKAAMAHMKMRQFNFLIHTISQSLVAIAGIATLAVGAGMVIANTLTAGALIAVMALAWRILGPIRNIFLSALSIGQSLQSVEQIDRLMQMPLERDPNSDVSIARTFTGRIAFDRVTFRYPTQREPALRSVSLKLEPGQLMCLCGHSGSGKSTILRILLGLHQQQAGSVFVDGLDLRQLDKGEWRHSLGVATQSSELFYGTVAQNLRLAHPAATDKEIQEITRRFGVDEHFGSVLDQGLNTKFTAAAHTAWPDALIRRITLCRAFIGNPPIYLLDDPAANLDVDGENALLEMIEERRRDSAIIMTTHRPSHMRLADLVVWLDHGAVRDIGPPDKVVPNLLAG